MQIKIFFIRHAESTFNAYGDRSKNVPITDKGRNIQSPLLKGSPDLIICSTLLRAKQTLENSKLNCNNIIYSDLCREIRNGNNCDYFENEDTQIQESKLDVTLRINQLKNLIINNYNNYKNIYVISHSCLIHRITGVYLANCQMIEHILEI